MWGPRRKGRDTGRPTARSARGLTLPIAEAMNDCIFLPPGFNMVRYLFSLHPTPADAREIAYHMYDILIYIRSPTCPQSVTPEHMGNQSQPAQNAVGEVETRYPAPVTLRLQPSILRRRVGVGVQIISTHTHPTPQPTPQPHTPEVDANATAHVYVWSE